jgi:SAM-dependent methyltransferase
MTAIVTGEAYFRAITEKASDRRARAAFQQLVLRTATPGARLFDFGAGPGIDARFYAEHGFRVSAYDADPEMRAFFGSHCRDFIDSGRVVLEQGDYREFLAPASVAAGGAFELITSNFAPFNLVPDLPALFAKFHALAAPDARVLASVLSPYCISDLRYGWAWRNAPRLWRHGCYTLPGPQFPSTRRTLGNFAAHSAPYFTLERVYRGLPAHSGRDAIGVDVRRGIGFSWLQAATSQFMFLLFRKTAH